MLALWAEGDKQLNVQITVPYNIATICWLLRLLAWTQKAEANNSMK